MPVYATVADLARLGVSAEALRGVPIEAQQSALSAASSLVDDYLGKAYTLPLVSWSDSLRRAAAIVAAYDLMSARGYNPSGDDTNLRDRYLDVIRWLEKVSSGAINAGGIVDSAAGSDEATAVTETTAQVGWAIPSERDVGPIEVDGQEVWWR